VYFGDPGNTGICNKPQLLATSVDSGVNKKTSSTSSSPNVLRDDEKACVQDLADDVVEEDHMVR